MVTMILPLSVVLDVWMIKLTCSLPIKRAEIQKRAFTAILGCLLPMGMYLERFISELDLGFLFG